MTRNPLRRTTDHDPDETPVVLPHAVVAVTDHGTLKVTVDGQPFDPEGTEPWTRESFGELLDTITQDRTNAVRVEIRETDGTVFTDIIGARKRPTPPQDQPAGSGGRHAGKKRHDLIEVTAEGFVSDEEVAVAVIVAHTDTTGTGRARCLVDADQLGPTREVVLLGRTSGTVVIERARP